MKQEIYERNYLIDKDRQNDQEDVFKMLKENKLLQAYKASVEARPKYIIEEDRQNYKYLLERCDELARSWKGYLIGIVDHEKYYSVIRVIMPLIEFSSDEELILLGEIADKARCVSFTVEEGKVKLSIFIDYFAEVPRFTADKGEGQ